MGVETDRYGKYSMTKTSLILIKDSPHFFHDVYSSGKDMMIRNWMMIMMSTNNIGRLEIDRIADQESSKTGKCDQKELDGQ